MVSSNTAFYLFPGPSDRPVAYITFSIFVVVLQYFLIFVKNRRHAEIESGSSVNSRHFEMGGK